MKFNSLISSFRALAEVACAGVVRGAKAFCNVVGDFFKDFTLEDFMGPVRQLQPIPVHSAPRPSGQSMRAGMNCNR